MYSLRVETDISKETAWQGLDWINLAHGKDQWWVLVSKVMNLQVP
jgi:hypothetical protein